MNDETFKDCYGTMFPDSLHLKENVPNEGKVFTVWLKRSKGSVLPVRSDSSVEVNYSRWQECRQCAEFESCYQLSMAKMALEAVVASQ